VLCFINIKSWTLVDMNSIMEKNDLDWDKKKRGAGPTMQPGYLWSPIHGRYPTTAPCGSFCLLCFHPGPIRFSLDNLEILGSPEITILTPSLVRTPDQHESTTDRTPDLKQSTAPSLLVAGLQEHATTPSCS